MKKFLYVLAASALLSGCCGPNYTVTGRYGLLPGDSIFLYDYMDNVLAEGIVAADTTFTLRGYTPQPDVATLNDRNHLSLPVPVFLEQGIIRIEPAPEESYHVTGTPMNDSMKEMNEKLHALRDEYIVMTPETPREEVEALFARFNEIPRQLADANPDNVLGLYLFSAYEFPSAMQDSTAWVSVKERMSQFSETMQNHVIMQNLRSRLEAVENTQIGKPYTDLTLPDTAGKPVVLSSLVGPGRWVLLDFWATWCSPCMAEVEVLQNVYGQYKDKGFEIYGVSLDNDTDRWRQIVCENGMTWPNVQGTDSNKKSDAATRYCIVGIPANFLISPEGIITAKNLRGEELERKLSEVLK